MNLTVQELKAGVRAATILRSLLNEQGPEPLDRKWDEGERHLRACEVESLLGQLKRSITSHHRLCKVASRCLNHSVDMTLEGVASRTLFDCLSVAHILYTAAGPDLEPSNKLRYQILHNIRSVLFKTGGRMVGGMA